MARQSLLKIPVRKEFLRRTLSWLEENTPPDEEAMRRFLHLLRAFCASKPDQPFCTLSPRGFLKYIQEKGVPPLFPEKGYTEATFRRKCSQLCTKYLQPACQRLGHEGQYVRADIVHGTNDSATMQLFFRKVRDKYGRRIQRLYGKKLDNRQFMEAFRDPSTENGKDPTEGASWPLPNAISDDARSSRRTGIRENRKNDIADTPVVEHQPEKGIIATPGLTEPYELTQLVFLVKLPDELSPEQIRRALRPYRRACSQIVRQYRGRLYGDKDTDGRIVAYFGYGDSSEMYSQTAVEAALRLAHFCRDAQNIPKTAIPGLEFFLLLHSDKFTVKQPSETREHPTFLSIEASTVLDQLEEMARPNTVLVSPQTQVSIARFFSWRPICVSGQNSKARQEDIVAYEVVREQNMPTLFNPGEAQGIPLVGRKRQLKILKKAWHAATKGQAKIAWIHAMMGMGKSRLVYEFVSYVRTKAGRTPILLCQCRDYHDCTPFYPVAQMFIQQLELTRDLSKEQIEQKLNDFVQQFGLDAAKAVPHLLRLVSDAAEWPSANESEPGERAYRSAEAAAWKERIQEILLDLLTAMARNRPVLLLIKDIHWVDVSTQDLINKLVKRLAVTTESLRIMVVVTFRRWRDLVPSKDEDLNVFLELGPLEPKDARALVGYVTSKEHISITADNMEEIIKDAKGVPFVLREKAGGKAPVTWIKKVLHESEGEQGLEQDATGIGSKRVAQVAAILGMDFSYDRLRTVIFGSRDITTEQEKLLQNRLDYLIEARILSKIQQPPKTRYRFTYDNIYTIILRSMSTQDQEKHHLMVARTFEQYLPEVARNEPEILARRYSRAGKQGAEKAVFWWRRTAEKARKGWADAEAIQALEKALTLTSEIPDPVERDNTKLALWLDIAEASTIVKSPEDIHAAYEKAKQLAEKVDKTPLAFRAHWGHWLLTYLQGRLQSAKDLAEGLFELPGCKESAAYEQESCHAMWDTLFHLGRFRTALVYHYHGMTAASSVPINQHSPGLAGHSAQVCCLARGALALWFLGYGDQALNISRKAIDLADELQHPNSIAQAHCLAALLHVLCLDTVQAKGKSKQALEIANDKGLSQRRIMAQVILATAQLKEQSSQENINQLEDAISGWRSTGVKLFETFWLAMLAEAYLVVGSTKRGLEMIREAMNNATAIGERFYEPELHRINGELHLATSRRNRIGAERCFRKSIEVARELEAKPLALRALISLNSFLQTCRGRQQDKKDAQQMLKTTYESLKNRCHTSDIIKVGELLS